ncbi:putative NAD(P)-binding domain superfamily [Septoria linicola]|nr:putative NAD(P)-binding domain superfamily [Septoria linicola]
MGDIGAASESPTTLDITVPPPDELCMSFSAAASVSNGSENFIANRSGPFVCALPLSAGVTVSGELVDDPSTITAPFLPGDTILACLIPPKPCLLSAHEDSLRLRIPTISALELPGNMLPETGCSYLTALMTGAAILKQELHIPITRTPTASPTPAEDTGVESYNNKRILIIGGQTQLGAALVQLIHRALPDARVYVTSTMDDEPELFQRTIHMMGLGAVYAIDGNADDLTDHLSPSFDMIFNTVKKQSVREDVLKSLDGMKRLIDCGTLDVEKAVSSFLEDEPDCVTSLHEMLLKAADVFDTYEQPGSCAYESDVGKIKCRLEREDSGKVLEAVA